MRTFEQSNFVESYEQNRLLRLEWTNNGASLLFSRWNAWPNFHPVSPKLWRLDLGTGQAALVSGEVPWDLCMAGHRVCWLGQDGSTLRIQSFTDSGLNHAAKGLWPGRADLATFRSGDVLTTYVSGSGRWLLVNSVTGFWLLDLSLKLQWRVSAANANMIGFAGDELMRVDVSTPGRIEWTWFGMPAGGVPIGQFPASESPLRELRKMSVNGQWVRPLFPTPWGSR